MSYSIEGGDCEATLVTLVDENHTTAGIAKCTANEWQIENAKLVSLEAKLLNRR